MSRQDRSSWLATQRPHRRRNRRRPSPIGSPYARRLHVEALEDRRMLAAITVTSSADNLFVDGMVTLREAIQAANTNLSVDGSVAGSVGADTITFDASLSGQTITLGNTELLITEAVTIDATSLAQSVTVNANLQSRIFNITAPTGDFTFRGLTITGGKTIASNEGGGAIRSLTSGTLTLGGSTVSGNSTAGQRAYGGGIFSFGTVTLTSSTVSGNSTAGSLAHGGGIYSRGAVTLTSSTVSGNSTAGGGSGGGGGIFSFGTVTLTSSTVSGNSTAGDRARGGGIYSYSAVTLTSSTVTGNSTADANAYGGGIYSRGTVTLTSSTVSGNSTAGSNANGGGILSRGTVTLTSSTVSGNSTAGPIAYGGGIYSNGTVTLTSSTVSGNSTAGSGAYGGGIFSFGTVTLTSSTVTDNHANFGNATGGGIWNYDDPITITNSIVAGNTAGGGSPDLQPGTGTLAVNYSLIEQTGLAFTGTGNTIGSPAGLGPLTNNGGLTETHALLEGSPAIDRGDPGVLSPPSYDQRGFAFDRIVGGRIDMGAFESGAASADFDIDKDIDGFDFLTWQRGFGDSPAVHSDGDANVDDAIDGADLSVWEGQFGLTPAPLAAVESPQGSVAAQFAPAPLANDLLVPSAAELIDAAIAWESASASNADELPPMEDPPNSTKASYDAVFSIGNIAPMTRDTEADEFRSMSSREVGDAEDQWLTDELLERVFG